MLRRRPGNPRMPQPGRRNATPVPPSIALDSLKDARYLRDAHVPFRVNAKGERQNLAYACLHRASTPKHQTAVLGLDRGFGMRAGDNLGQGENNSEASYRRAPPIADRKDFDVLPSELFDMT